MRAALDHGSPESTGGEDIPVTLSDLHNLLQHDKELKRQLSSETCERQNTSVRKHEVLFDDREESPKRLTSRALGTMRDDNRPR